MTFSHPKHGTLTVGSRVGRSRICTDSDGKQYTFSSKMINKLSGPKTEGPTTASPEEFVASVGLYLESLGDGPVQQATARDVWLLTDKLLSAPKL